MTLVKGKDAFAQTGRYGKGAIKRGLQIMRQGIKELNTMKGIASVIGSVSNVIMISVKYCFCKAYE